MPAEPPASRRPRAPRAPSGATTRATRAGERSASSSSSTIAASPRERQLYGLAEVAGVEAVGLALEVEELRRAHRRRRAPARTARHRRRGKLAEADGRDRQQRRPAAGSCTQQRIEYGREGSAGEVAGVSSGCSARRFDVAQERLEPRRAHRQPGERLLEPPRSSAVGGRLAWRARCMARARQIAAADSKPPITPASTSGARRAPTRSAAASAPSRVRAPTTTTM